MTEAEWLTCRDPITMLNHLKVDPNDRKTVLLTLAYVDRIWDMTIPNPIRDWAEQARLLVEGRGDPVAYKACEEEACHYIAACDPGYLRKGISPWSYEALACLFYFAQAEEDEWEPVTELDELSALAIQAEYVRDIFGNPFRDTPAIDPAWLTPKVVSIAKAIYDKRAFDRMPDLADAVGDAGCDNQDMLLHRRSRSDHVRGCWVLDLLLGSRPVQLTLTLQPGETIGEALNRLSSESSDGPHHRLPRSPRRYRQPGRRLHQRRRTADP